MIDEETINEIKSQLWDYLQHLRGQIDEMHAERHIIKNWSWLGDQYRFCKSEIAYWKSVGEGAK